MKSYLFRASSILGVLIMLVGVSLSGMAQQSPRQQQQQQVQPQEERVLRELAVQPIDAETLRVAVPGHCRGITPVIQTHSNGPGSPSAALLSFIGNHARKGFNNPAVNTYFGDSFKLNNCRVCYATIEAKVQHYGDAWSNDSLTVGAAAPLWPLANRFASGYIWPPNFNSNTNTFTWVLATAALDTYVTTGPLPPKFLDVYSQDDTDFHSVTLSVWYY